MSPPVRVEPLGDCALQVTLGDAPDEAARLRVAAATRRLESAGLPGVVECVPGFTTVTLHLDPDRVSTWPADLAERIASLLERIDAADAGVDRLVEIPVCYGGELGPDLDHLAASHGLTADAVVRIHSGAEYRVHLLGFIPGFPYLSGLDPRLHTPRRAVPRTSVPAGSVAIGGGQAGIYPLDSPGGWHLIGRTPLRLFDPRRPDPALLRPGDRIRFVAVDAAEYRRLERA